MTSLNAWANDPPLLAEIRKLGIAHLRGGMILNPTTRQLNYTAAQAAACVRAIAAAGFQATSIVWHPDHIDWLLGENGVGSDRDYRNWLRSIITIEVGNECNIATNKQMSPADYADFASACIARCAELGFAPPYIGGPHNINNAAAMQWLADVVRRLQTTAAVRYALHSYVADPQRNDWRKLTDADMVRARKIIGTRRFAITETGLWNAPRIEKKLLFGFIPYGTEVRVWTEPYVAQWAPEMLAYWRTQGADFVSWYQLNDSPNGMPKAQVLRSVTDGESFGIRRYNLENPYDWKPVALALGGSQ